MQKPECQTLCVTTAAIQMETWAIATMLIARVDLKVVIHTAHQAKQPQSHTLRTPLLACCCCLQLEHLAGGALSQKLAAANQQRKQEQQVVDTAAAAAALLAAEDSGGSADAGDADARESKQAQARAILTTWHA